MQQRKTYETNLSSLVDEALAADQEIETDNEVYRRP
jgi:hypothetical protein